MEIKPEDIIIQTYRKRGYSNWGHRPDDSVKLYHTPSGITVVSEEQGGVFRNKAIALRKLEEELCWIEYRKEAACE